MIESLPNTIDALQAVDPTISLDTSSSIILATATGELIYRMHGAALWMSFRSIQQCPNTSSTSRAR